MIAAFSVSPQQQQQPRQRNRIPPPNHMWTRAKQTLEQIVGRLDAFQPPYFLSRCRATTRELRRGSSGSSSRRGGHRASSSAQLPQSPQLFFAQAGSTHRSWSFAIGAASHCTVHSICRAMQLTRPVNSLHKMPTVAFSAVVVREFRQPRCSGPRHWSAQSIYQDMAFCIATDAIDRER